MTSFLSFSSSFLFIYFCNLFISPYVLFFKRLQLYQLVELKVQGDGNCQVSFYAQSYDSSVPSVSWICDVCVTRSHCLQYMNRCCKSVFLEE